MLVRQNPGKRNEQGRFQHGKEREIPIRVRTEPVGGRERQALPEGLRERDLRKFWTVEPIEAVLEGSTGTGGDRIRYNGSVWQATMVADWSGFFEVLAVRQPR